MVYFCIPTPDPMENLTVSSIQSMSISEKNTTRSSLDHEPPISNLNIHRNSVEQQDFDIIPSDDGKLLLPFPQDNSDVPGFMHQHPSDNAAIPWPLTVVPKLNQLPRTKSFINIATTIAGSNSHQLLLENKSSDYPELDYLQLILQASTRVYDVAIESPMTFAKNLSAKVGRGNKIHLKREDMQPVCFSFKIRGAYNRMYVLTPEERKRGVIAVSAGNHAQGVALSAKKLGIRAVIVMPTTAPEIKVTNVRRLGATVIMYGVDLEEAKKECLLLSQKHGFVFVPPYDDPYIIAGQGTTGMEILKQVRHENVNAIFVPVGGGGLISGIAAFVKRVQPSIRIIGVNTVDSSGMTTSLQKGERVTLPKVGLFSDGTAVRQIGSETYRLCSMLLDDMVLVTVDEICAAIKDVFDDTRSILEPAGALGVAGVKKYLLERGKDIKDGVFVAVTSGANMNFDRLRFVCERTRIGEGKEMLLSCKVKENQGTFAQLYSSIFPRAVTEISYRYSNHVTAHVFLAFEVASTVDGLDVLDEINKQAGMDAIDVTHSNLAKSHLRYLVGGNGTLNALTDERLFSFKFAERPGALRLFLDAIQSMSAALQKDGSSCNLSLVHYRYNGGDVARILIGLQVPTTPESESTLQSSLLSFSHEFTEETSDPTYKHFFR